jgi:hypothetical protein
MVGLRTAHAPDDAFLGPHHDDGVRSPFEMEQWSDPRDEQNRGDADNDEPDGGERPMVIHDSAPDEEEEDRNRQARQGPPHLKKAIEARAREAEPEPRLG